MFPSCYLSNLVFILDNFGNVQQRDRGTQEDIIVIISFLLPPSSSFPSPPLSVMEGISVAMVPLPAQGHLNQLLHLSRIISSRSISVHYVGSATHNRQARDRVHGWDPTTTRFLHFHDLPLPPFSTPSPDPNSPIKFPSHLQPTFEAALHLQSPLTSLLHLLASTSRRVILIHDSSMSFAANAAASFPNVESYAFQSVSAITSLFFHWESHGIPPTPEITSLNLSQLSFKGCFTDEFLNFVRRQHQMTSLDAGRLLNTCRAIEGEFIDQIAREPRWKDQKIFAIGPLNPIVLSKSDGLRRHECLDWLDKQPSASVVYVSFGTTSSMSADQIRELAAGLESSGQRFVWVLRGADRGDIYASSEEGETGPEKVGSEFDRRLEGRGMVVRGWAPQLEILAHAATGGFMSHCGWNSCMESMSLGVPILAWPMHSDQPRNAQLVTEVLRVGAAVRDWGRRDEVVESTVIRESILRLMVDDEGKEMRRRAERLGDAVRQAISDGGTSREDLDSFIAHITR